MELIAPLVLRTEPVCTVSTIRRVSRLKEEEMRLTAWKFGTELFERILRGIGCFFGYHGGGVLALGSAMGRFGPRYLYQCKRCKRYFSEPWG